MAQPRHHEKQHNDYLASPKVKKNNPCCALSNGLFASMYARNCTDSLRAVYKPVNGALFAMAIVVTFALLKIRKQHILIEKI
jgi:hypothetical protein